MTFEEKTISSEYVFRGKLINVRRDVVTTVDGTSVREIVEHQPGAVIAAIKKNGNMLMERQFRKPAEKVIFEAPAGKVDPGEDPLQAAVRELKEETGYTAEHMRLLASSYPSVGFSKEVLHTFLATGLTEGETDLDENEAIDIEEYPLEELYEMAMRGEIDDGKTLIAILMAHEAVRRGELDNYLEL